MKLITKKLKAAVYAGNESSGIIYENGESAVFETAQDFAAHLSRITPENRYTEINILLPDNLFRFDTFGKKAITLLDGAYGATIEENLAKHKLCAARIAPCICYAAEAAAEKHALNNCAIFLNEQAFYTFALFDGSGDFLYVLSAAENSGRLSKAERMLRAYGASVDNIKMEKLFIFDGTGRPQELQKEAEERFNAGIQIFEAGIKVQKAYTEQVPASLLCAYGAIR